MPWRMDTNYESNDGRNVYLCLSIYVRKNKEWKTKVLVNGMKSGLESRVTISDIVTSILTLMRELL